ncbi:MAG: ATP-binding protein [Lachnospiraceae bacterium]
MHALNLYTISREIDDELLPLYERALSDRNEFLKIRKEEIELIKTIVNNLHFFKAEKYCYENWFYSFSIPQIGKEFDLLKISLDNKIINIEIKSQEVSLEKIEKQLIQNRYYLSHVASEIYSFTCMRCNNNTVKVFKYDSNCFQESTMDELIQYINIIVEAKDDNIENMFRPKDYLISPLNTPEKFLEGKYYLNNQQEQIKKRIIETIMTNTSLWGIKGSAGTGKTLLLYDIAKTLSENVRVGVIHCGILNEGHIYLNSHLTNISIIDAKSITEEWLSECQIVCVDETQRLYKSSVDLILQDFSEGRLWGCIFSYDSAQALSKTEVRRNNPKRLNEITGFREEKLTERIRTNKEIYSFIRNMLRLYDRPHEKMQYKNIDILYANDVSEADEITRFYRSNGYTFLTFTPSQYVSNSIDHYSGYVNSHQVIGQEFDKVILVLDNNFRYSKEGELEGKEHPNPDYLFPRLFYQNISRTREKLCLIILNNPDMFEKLLKIKENCLDYFSGE